MRGSTVLHWGCNGMLLGCPLFIIFIFSSLLIIVLDRYNCTEHPASHHCASKNPVHFARGGNARLRDTKVRHH
jgi:hypothetical protein